MASHKRKFLFAKDEQIPAFDKKYSSNCYMCFVCPDNCYISSPPPPQLPEPDPTKTHVPRVLILMLCTLAFVFLFLLYLTITRYRFRRRDGGDEFLEDSRADENQGPVLDHPIWYIRTVGLPQTLIDSIASFQYKKGDGLIDCNDCSICLNDFEENEKLRLLPKCSHAFHVNCIDTWLKSHKNCPVCRAPILMVRSTSRARHESSSSSPVPVPAEATLTAGTVMPIVEDPVRVLRRVGSDLSDGRVKVDDRRRVRRSVSVDLSLAADGGEGCSGDVKVGRMKRDCSKNWRMMKSSSLQKGGVSMKRSFSFSGMRSFRKFSRSQGSIAEPSRV